MTRIINPFKLLRQSSWHHLVPDVTESVTISVATISDPLASADDICVTLLNGSKTLQDDRPGYVPMHTLCGQLYNNVTPRGRGGYS